MAAFVSTFRNHTALQLEILALRHQIGVLQRTTPKLRLKPTDRLFWAWLSRIWKDWQSALVIVKPGTVIAWVTARR
jgi:putative transposase